MPFFSAAGTEFMEVFVGVGASRVRDMFAKARKAAPCILFIDEFDGIGQQRSYSSMGNDGVLSVSPSFPRLSLPSPSFSLPPIFHTLGLRLCLSVCLSV